jgi:glutaredoxin
MITQLNEKTIMVYTLPNCPNCEKVKALLNEMYVSFGVISMEIPEVVADLRYNGCFEVVAPIIQLDDKYYTYDEFIAGKSKEENEMAMGDGSNVGCNKTTITDDYKRIMKDIFDVKEQRGKMYRKEPKDIVPIETLEHLAYLKSVRGMECLDLGKKIDEYTDLVNYAVFVLERLYKERERLNPNCNKGMKGSI